MAGSWLVVLNRLKYLSNQRMVEMAKENYNIKIDDMLLYLLNEYHKVDASDALTFFHDRVEEMRDLQPNINEKSRASTVVCRNPLDYRGTDIAHRTRQGKWGGQIYTNDKSARFYVLRGFYPDTNLPFKMIVVYDSSYNHATHVKVIMGMKPHYSVIRNNIIEQYKIHASEAIILDQPVPKSDKINYKYRDFKCMRPKGMELYHARNHKQKQKEKAIARQEAKNDK